MTQLYLISPPSFELADFSKQLQAALSACHPREGGHPELHTPSPQIPAQGGDDVIYIPPARDDINLTHSANISPLTHPAGDNATLTPPAGGGGKGGAGGATLSEWIEPSPNPSRKREGNLLGAFQLRLKEADDAKIRAAIKELLPICRDHGVAFIINDRVDLCIELQLDGVHVGQEDLLHYPSLLSFTHPANSTSSTPSANPTSSTPPASPIFSTHPAGGGGKGGAGGATLSEWIEPSPNPSRQREGNENTGRKREGNENMGRKREGNTSDGRKREGSIALSANDVIRHIRARLSDDMALGVTCHASKHLAMEAAEAGADYVAFGAFYPTTSKPIEKLEKWGTPMPDIIQWWTQMTEIPCVAIGGITPQNCAPLVQAGADFIAVITSIWNYPDGPANAINAFEQAIAHAKEAQK